MTKKEGPGFIYVFWNQQWVSGFFRQSPYSKYYKVGETKRNPEDRIKEYRTYSPFKTVSKFELKTSKRLLAEKAIHLRLKKWHLYEEGAGREFFKRRLGRIISTVVETVNDVERGAVYVNMDNKVCYRNTILPGQ